MAKLIRWVGIIVGLLVLLSILLSVAVYMLVDPNDYRAEIETAVTDATGRTLSIDGELSLKTFPCCGIRLGALSLSNPPGFPDQPFASIEGAAVSVQLLPLILSQELHIGQVELAGLDLQMISRADGTNNWEMGGATGAETEAEPDTADSGPGEFGVAGVSVSDGQIAYRDEATGGDIRLSDINISIGKVALGEPFSLSMAFNAEGLLEGMKNAVSLDTDVSLDLDAGSVALENLGLALDDIVAKGWLRIPDMDQGQIAFDLAVDALDADIFLGPPAEEPEPASEAETTGDEPLDLPLQDLRALNIDGSLGIGELKAAGATLTNVKLGLVAKNGLIRLNPFNADLYGGSYAGDVQLDARGQKPKVSLNDTLSSVHLGELLTAMTGESQLAGIGNLSIDATTTGNTVNEMMGALNGDVSLSMDEGRYLGTDIWYEIRKAKAKYSKTDLPEEPENPYTDVTEFSGSANVTNGVVRNDEFTAGAPFLRLTGNGSINLLTDALDYRLIARMVGTPEFGGDEGLGELEGIDIPVDLSGSLDSIDFSIDWGGIFGSAIEQKRKRRRKRCANARKRSWKA
jgi:AsmA protein